MARLPPPSAGRVVLFSSARLARLGVGALDGQVIHLGALERGPHRGVGVDAEEHVGATVVGKRRSIVERHGAIVVARQEHLEAEPAFDQRAQAPRDRQRDLFFERALRALRAELVAAVARIDHHGAQTGRRPLRRNHQPACPARATAPASARRRWSSGSRSIVRRPEPASACEVVTRCSRVARAEREHHRRRRVAGRRRREERSVAAPAECSGRAHRRRTGRPGGPAAR